MPPLSENAPQHLVWPPPPEEARIAYVQTIRQPSDVGIRQSGLSRFFQHVFGTGGSEQLLKPFGIALDEHGNLCLTDTGANSVIYYDRQEKTWQHWNQAGTIRFVTPVAVAKTNGVLFVADPGLGQIVAFDTAGKLRWAVRNGLQHPAGLALAAGKLFVADAHTHRVVVFDLEGHYQFAFGKRGGGPGEFNFPTHLATGGGHLLVTDSINSRVQVFDTAGNFQSQIGAAGDVAGYFSRPKGVAVDAFEHVYVVDANFDNVQIFDLHGRLLLYVGDAGASVGQFWLPNGIAISPQNEIFVTDCYNHRVQVFKYVGAP